MDKKDKKIKELKRERDYYENILAKLFTGKLR